MCADSSSLRLELDVKAVFVELQRFLPGGGSDGRTQGLNRCLVWDYPMDMDHALASSTRYGLGSAGATCSNF